MKFIQNNDRDLTCSKTALIQKVEAASDLALYSRKLYAISPLSVFATVV